MSSMRLVPLGDCALLVELGDRIDAATHARVRAAFEALSAADLPGVFDIVPAYTAVAVHYDPLAFTGPDAIPYDTASRTVLRALEMLAPTEPAVGRTVEIPVRYGGESGPDIEHVASHSGLSVAAVIDLHASAEYTVYVIGFSPGFPFLAGLPPQLATPRRASPRAAVPAGSVGIAGVQTGVYPLETPGGWNIIGRTTARLFVPEHDPPALLRIGDGVRFLPVDGP
ncbi:MAG TPA: 5-oxoprolinase subunit PxpB [Longimicrobiales bacterium]